MRIERIGLEHHRDAAFGGRQVHDRPVGDDDLTAAQRLQPGNQTQQGGFTAPGRPHENDELALVDFKVDVPDDLCLAKGLVDVPQLDLGHLDLLE